MHTDFLNPYNFIPFPEKKAMAYVEEGEKHTGVIEYSITTKSPLFIPNTTSDKAFEGSVEDHKSFDFYSYTQLNPARTYNQEYQEPVIPGSELRGMLRSVYETLTDSCMGILNENNYPIMRIQESYQAGLLKRRENGGYQLVEAEDCIYRKLNKNNPTHDPKKKYLLLYMLEKTLEGSKIYFNKRVREGKCKSLIESISTSRDAAHNEEGYLIKGMPDGSIGKKHNCHVFIPQNSKAAEVADQDIERLKQVLKAYQDEPTASPNSKPYEEYEKQLENFLKGKGNEYFPVYYSKVNEKLLYLAPACFTKEPSTHTLKELAGDMAPCKALAKNCPACDLFGMVGENNEQASGSKIRFADAYVAEKKENAAYYDEIITLETLGKPRINNVEFYLQRPQNADFWNYDYYTVKGRMAIAMGKLRGRKFYWHQNGKKLPKGVEATKLNKTIRPVSSGNVFTGKLFFEGITGKQLDQLLWLLNGGNSEEQPQNGPLAYKLGMSKPLGMGSVVLRVTKLAEREVRLENDRVVYELKEECPNIPVYEVAEFSKAVKGDFFTIAALEATNGKLVTYPITADQQGQTMTEGFKWFQENHIGYDYKKQDSTRMPNKRVQLNREYALPAIKGVKTLPILEATDPNKKPQIQKKDGEAKTSEGGFNGINLSNVMGPKVGDSITCIITKEPMPDRKVKGKFFAYASYNGCSVSVFELPAGKRKGNEVKIKVISASNNKISGVYQGEERDGEGICEFYKSSL